MAKQVMDYLEYINKPLTVAVMGCIVNGPGESKNADLGLAGGRQHWILFKKGQVVKTVSANEAFAALKEQIDLF